MNRGDDQAVVGIWPDLVCLPSISSYSITNEVVPPEFEWGTLLDGAYDAMYRRILQMWVQVLRTQYHAATLPARRRQILNPGRTILSLWPRDDAIRLLEVLIF